MARVHLASCRASDLVSTQPSASAACRTRWLRASAWTARCSAAWPLVTRSEWTSQVRVVRCPSARCPSWASKTASSRPRTAASIASLRSIIRSRSATAWPGRAAASSAARNRSAHSCMPAADPSMSNASAAVAGTVVVHMSWLTSSGPLGVLFLIRLYPGGMTFLAAPRRYSIMGLDRFELTSPGLPGLIGSGQAEPGQLPLGVEGPSHGPGAGGGGRRGRRGYGPGAVQREGDVLAVHEDVDERLEVGDAGSLLA